jgi:hypothetical protein
MQGPYFSKVFHRSMPRAQALQHSSTSKRKIRNLEAPADPSADAKSYVTRRGFAASVQQQATEAPTTGRNPERPDKKDDVWMWVGADSAWGPWFYSP